MKKIQNDNGIKVCDSIIMSINKKRVNTRYIEAICISLMGYIATIMSFLKMFDFNYSSNALIISGVIFSSLYIMLAVAGKKAMFVVGLTGAGGLVIAYKLYDTLSLGYKFMYNIIYRTSTHKEIDYYKFLNTDVEKSSVTVFFIFCMWVMALVIYIFTIYRSEIIPPLLVTFPIIETGLYNGIEISIIWGMLTVAYWLALFAMSITDSGEYSGGFGGFVRKENTFFPKRQMRLKVTEKCAIYIIVSVAFIALTTSAVLNITNYKRSDSINQKRVEIRDAVNSFSMEDFAGSVSQLTSAFGVSFKVQTHRLGNIDKLKYKEVTDMTVTLDKAFDGALYIKEYTGSVYNNNEWTSFSDNVYKDGIFKDFEKYNIHPQNFPYIFNYYTLYSGAFEEYNMTIDSKLRKNRTFAPYGIDNSNMLEYDYDMGAIAQKGTEFTYVFADIYAQKIIESSSEHNYDGITLSRIEDNENLIEYLKDKNPEAIDSDFITVNSQLIKANSTNKKVPESEQYLAMLIEEEYEKFVKENYLEVPKTEAMSEVRKEYSELFARKIETNEEKLQFLYDLRERMGQSVEYSLNPGKTPKSRDFVNYFLIENKKGYCTHYATSGVILARMAGIPARYASGYVVVGDDFNIDSKNPDGTYTINVKDSRSHAWVEVYLDDYGWIPFEFTAGYTPQTIDTTPTTTEETTVVNTETTTVDTQEQAASNTTTRRRQSGTTTTTFTMATTVTTTAETGSSGGGGTGSINTTSILKVIIYIIAVIVSVVVIILTRRFLIIFIRKRHFKTGSHKSRIKYMYEYAEKLLRLKNYEQEEQTYAEFAEYVEKSLGGVYFKENSFLDFTNLALRSTFSDRTPENKELENSIEFVNELADNIYRKAESSEKLYMKFILALI